MTFNETFRAVEGMLRSESGARDAEHWQRFYYPHADIQDHLDAQVDRHFHPDRFAKNVTPAKPAVLLLPP